jgi:hypothetical protein
MRPNKAMRLKSFQFSGPNFYSFCHLQKGEEALANRDHRLRDPQNQVGRVSIDIPPPCAMSVSRTLQLKTWR